MLSSPSDSEGVSSTTSLLQSLVHRFSAILLSDHVSPRGHFAPIRSAILFALAVGCVCYYDRSVFVASIPTTEAAVSTDSLVGYPSSRSAEADHYGAGWKFWHKLLVSKLRMLQFLQIH